MWGGEDMRMVARMPALQSADYRFLFYNTVLAAAARWALMLARGWLVFELTDSTGAVGIVTFAGMAPFLFLSARSEKYTNDPAPLVVNRLRSHELRHVLADCSGPSEDPQQNPVDQ